MKPVSKQTIGQMRKSLQEIYVENLFRFIENKYKTQNQYISEKKQLNLSKKWLKRKEVIDILNLISRKLFEFFETEFKNNEKEIKDFLLIITNEFVKENPHKSPLKTASPLTIIKENQELDLQNKLSQIPIDEEKLNNNDKKGLIHQDL